ncbi:MAG: hypothetical protein IJV17_03435 [Prevotella sp.]|nr:hypothetical protein [Prevotella sp.]
MMNEENILRERMSKENPFRVPEGYFDDFANQVMAMLPEREQKPVAKRVLLRPWMYAAACLLVAVFCVTVYFSRMTADEPVETPQIAAVSETYMDEAADYAMLDNAEIYACLADN